ncbi:MAG: hypothetical protein NTNFB01_25460 [Nitrospira sp.]
MGIQRAEPFSRRKAAIGSEARDLPEGMHTGIRATGSDNRDPRLGNRRKRIFHGGLDGRRIELALPA